MCAKVPALKVHNDEKSYKFAQLYSFKFSLFWKCVFIYKEDLENTILSTKFGNMIIFYCKDMTLATVYGQQTKDIDVKYLSNQSTTSNK